MSTQVGRVEKTENGWAWVETRRRGCCGHTSHFQMIQGTDRMVVKARNSAGGKSGDEVELFIASKAKLKGLFFIYILPVGGLLLGALSAKSVAALFGLNGNFWLGFLTIAGFVLGVMAARFFAERMARRDELVPVLRRVLKRSHGADVPTQKRRLQNCASCSGCSV